MAFVLRIKDGDAISLRLEDGQEINVTIKHMGHSRIVTYINAPQSVRIDRIRTLEKELDERARDISE